MCPAMVPAVTVLAAQLTMVLALLLHALAEAVTGCNFATATG